MVGEISAETELLSDSASNLLNLYGRLPIERNRMLKIIDNYLVLSDRDKRIFSFHSRLDSFQNQYGGLTTDLWKLLAPYITDNGIDMSTCSDYFLENITRQIRSRLMP